MFDDWKTFLAIAVLVTPLAYCEIRSNDADSTAKIECFKQHGKWVSYSGGSCEFELDE